MRENYFSLMVATSVAICALLGLVFAYSSDVSQAVELNSLRSSVSAEISADSSGTDGADDTVTGSPTDFDPFEVPLILPEIEAPTYDITDGLIAARWADHVTVTMSDRSFRFQSNGLPNHELPNPFMALRGQRYSPAIPWAELDSVPTVQLIPVPIDQTITLDPILADEPNEAPVGLIGVLINGAQLYNDGDAPGQIEPATYATGYVDICNGHPAGVEADGVSAASYHYHAVPSCTTDGIDVEGQHSSIVGVLLDGFPVYGSNDVGGVAVQRRDLDECGGHFGPTPEFPEGIYHYHLLDEVSRDPISCLAGELDLGGDDLGADIAIDSGDKDSDVEAEVDDVEVEPGARGLGVN